MTESRSPEKHGSVPSFEQIVEKISRRESLKRLGMLTASAAIGASASIQPQASGATTHSNRSSASASTKRPGIGFDEIPHAFTNQPNDEQRCQIAEVPQDHRTQVVMSWGDPVVKGSVRLDFANPTPAQQEATFGYNNDFVGYAPLPRYSESSDHGLLCVNHEYTDPLLMFPDLNPEELTTEQIHTEMSAHGHSVVEIKRTVNADGATWERVVDSKLNRRISCLTTDFVLSGPAAGDDRVKTTADPEGRTVRGTVNNCAGGLTPWGTVLFAEENFHQYFMGEALESPELEKHRRYGIGVEPGYQWHRIDDRFNTKLEPNEPNRFGWVVEFDPYDPESVPVKRTALGRFRHEGAATSTTADGRLVVYMGDDQQFEYLYKFVSRDRFVADDASANRDLLDNGTLYVAKFYENQIVEWLPLVHGNGPLTKENGFKSQADVLIDTRLAADLLGATPMDRPEDVEENPVTGRVYAMLTNNKARTAEDLNCANPRGANPHGHVVELHVPSAQKGGYDHASLKHGWDLFLLAGDPGATETKYGTESPAGWLSCPDNCTFDNRGRIWIATDGGEDTSSIADGVYVCETDGAERAVPYHFLHGPKGAEICGPCFTPDNTTFFVAVQHPGEGSTYDSPATRWPNSPTSKLPPLPSVVAVTRHDPTKAVG